MLNRLVEDLRMLAHVEAGQLRLDKQWVDLVVLCEKQLAAFQAQANEQQITIKLIVFPLARKSYVSMAKMKELQPEMEALKEAAGDDRQKLQKG